MKINREKFDNAVLYIAARAGWDVGKKKLAKLLYFIDFTLYELREKSLTEMDYVKKDYGPMPDPITFYRALKRLIEDGRIKIKKQALLDRIIPIDEADINVFDQEEKDILNQIVSRHTDDNAGKLEILAQSEPPYKMVNYKDKIPYYLAFYRNTFGEMNLENDENTDSR